MTTQEEGLSKGEENRAAMQAQEGEAEGARVHVVQLGRKKPGGPHLSEIVLSRSTAVGSWQSSSRRHFRD